MKRTAKIPVGWLPYSPIGNQVPGTRFIAFKVPLRESYVDKLKPEDRFTVSILLDRIPELGLIIDLTQTTRYYNKNDILDRGVDYVKIPTPGQSVPLQHHVDRFFEVVDYYLDTHKGDDSLIGVHCTHGVNRTGYMLCRYLIQRLGYTYEEAVEAVGTARGHMIERSPYLASLRTHRDIVKKKTIRGDLEEGKSKMPKKPAVKPPKKVEPARPAGKERFGRRESYPSPPREMRRSRSPHHNRGRSPPGPVHPRHSPIRFDDRTEVEPSRSDRGMVPLGRDRMPGSGIRDRMQPSLQRGRSPPPMRGRSPPPHHMRGHTPPPRVRTPPSHMRGRTPPQMRGRTPPPQRGRTPPPHMQGRGPPVGPMRGRTPPPPHMRGRTPPPHVRGRTPPPHVRGRTPPHVRGRSPPPVRGRTPPMHVRGRTPPPSMRGRSPPPGPMRARTPPAHVRGRSPPPPPSQIRTRTPPGLSSSRSTMPTRGRSPPPSSQVRGRSPQFHTRGRTPPPPSRGRTPPPMPRSRSPIERSGRGRTPPGSIHRRISPSLARGRSPPTSARLRSPPRGRPDTLPHHSPSSRRDPFPPTRERTPPSRREMPPPSTGRSQPSSRRSPAPDTRREVPPSDPYYGYRSVEYESRRSSDVSREYPDKFNALPVYPSDPSSSSQYYSGPSGPYDHQRRDRSRSPHRRDSSYYSDRREGRKELSPPREQKRRKKSPIELRDKSRRSPHDYFNGREAIPGESRSYTSQHWERNMDPDGPDCREILNEKRSMRDPYGDPHEGVEYDDRRRSSFLDTLPPKNVDLRLSLEEEKRRKQSGFPEHTYPTDDYANAERVKSRRDYPDPGYQHSGEMPPTRPEYDYQYPTYQANPEPFPPGDSRRPAYPETHYPPTGDHQQFSHPPEQFGDDFRRPRGRGGKRIFDRLSRGGRGRGSNRV